jgi:hypothetical protein
MSNAKERLERLSLQPFTDSSRKAKLTLIDVKVESAGITDEYLLLYSRV